MTQQLYKHIDGNSVSELRNFLIGTGAAAPTVEGILQRRNGRWETFEGGKAQQLAFLADVAASTTFRGGHSGNALPTAAAATIRPNVAFEPGHMLIITAVSTITGIQGDDALDPGDLIIYVGADNTGNAVASNWTGISRAVDTSIYQIREVVTLASLPANTATLVKPATIKTISSYLILDGATVLNGAFDESFVASGANLGVTLTTLVAKSSLSIVFSGLA
jgi:hypothetical protein